MTQKERIAICKTCANSKFDMSRGYLCGLTDSKPVFELDCNNYERDPVAWKQEQRKQKEIQEEEAMKATGGLSEIGITNGNVTGVIMLILFVLINAITVFYLDRIFLYTLILPVFAVMGFI